MRTSLPMLTAAATLLACAGPTDLERDADALLVTNRSEYSLERLERGLRVEIGLTYSNRTGQVIHVDSCSGFITAQLQKLENGDWVHAWSAIGPEICFPDSMTIAPGEIFRTVVEVYGFEDGEGASPRFQVEQLNGTYRLFWHQVSWDGDRSFPPAYQVSNSFNLSVEQ